MQVGFTTLRGIVIQRPSLRLDALNVLLELTTHHGMYSLFHIRWHRILIHETEKRIRGAAINTVKLWVPHVQPMDSMIREFALQMLRKLQKLGPRPKATEAQSNGDVTMNGAEVAEDTKKEKEKDMETTEDEGAKPEIPAEEMDTAPREEGEAEDGQQSDEDLVYTPYLPERIELPAKKAQVLQHVELLFALSVKVPEFLDK
jgi:symplekin